MLERPTEQDDLAVASGLSRDGRCQRDALAVPACEVTRDLFEADVDADDGARAGGCRASDGCAQALGE
jgi:hypothetical protein